ncbi:hypothetical protein HIM_12289 [Hirsutella minnesotensis 3608]|uniref:Uncharacterized protein n=1 Tax=Hirsutella minnesotensis 3608 TaxID=1043627 RepID=A0A0F7ZW43_9HYPO|nr:hypothetical protein HIM_12289 [Hirsutella minnesotensis 3608]
MREPERLYVENNWKEKEKQFARAHTRHYPNLGCNTTQRNESYHVVVKASLNRQLPLQVACQKLAHSLKKLSQKITDDENRSRIDVPRLLDRPVFRHLIGKVPHYVLGKLAPEWEAAKALRWMRGTELQKERLASPVDTGCTKSSSNLGLSHSASFTRAGSLTALQWFVTGPCRMEMQRLAAVVLPLPQEGGRDNQRQPRRQGRQSRPPQRIRSPVCQPARQQPLDSQVMKLSFVYKELHISVSSLIHFLVLETILVNLTDAIQIALPNCRRRAMCRT